MRRFLVTAGVVVALAVPGVAKAEPAGNPFEIAREQTDSVRVASAQEGVALASWIGERSPDWLIGGAMRLRSLGRSSTLASPLDAGRVQAGLVAANPRLGQYLRVWTERTAPEWPSEEKLYAQALDASGAPLGTRHEVTASPDESQYPSSLTFNARTRQYLLTYIFAGEPGPWANAVLLSEQGVPTTWLSLPFQGWQWSVHGAVRRLDGSYLVATSERTADDSLEVRGQLFDVAGRRVGRERFLISNHSNLVGRMQNDDVEIAVDPESNEALVVWTDQYEVFGRRIGADGTPTGGDLWLSRMGPPSDPAWLTTSPDIAYNQEARQYLVVWQSGPGRDVYPAEEMVYGQHLDRTGQQIGANDFPIATADRAVAPAVTAFGGGNDFLVAWSSQRSSPSAWARRVTPTVQGPPARPPEANPEPDRPPLNPVIPVPPTSSGPPPTPVAANVPAAVAPTAPGGAPPSAAPQPTTPAGRRTPIAARILGSGSLRVFARQGLSVSVRCRSRCRATLRLTVSKQTAQRLRSGSTLARGSFELPRAGAVSVRLSPPRRLTRRLTRIPQLRLVVKVRAMGADGVVRRLERRVILR